MKSGSKFVNKLLMSPSHRHTSSRDELDSPGMPETPTFDTVSSPFMRPADVNVRHLSGIFAPQHHLGRDKRPNGEVENPELPEVTKDTPPEMLPVLSLLTLHNSRVYQEGYFMLLNDLNNDGKPVNNRKWDEVYGCLRGTQLATWDAAELDKNADPQPHYINIADASLKSIASLPSPNGELSNIIVLSTTMKNRYLLQFANTKLYQTWTAAFRLALFEHTSLQEAYTGALLSSKGSKLNGIRALLGPTKVKREGWCSVRFGAGMPWRKVWVVCTPGPLLTSKERNQGSIPGEPHMSKKDLAQYGRVAFYIDQKNLKKPLAVIIRANSVHAVFPEKAVLMNMSSLIKVEGHVLFAGEEKEPKLSIVHIMPDQRPGIQGFEVLIRFLIPMFDVFRLYGRPQRLNADKADIRSMLFALPTLPHAYYCDVADVMLLLSQAGFEHWEARVWNEKIRELLSRKIAAGHTGVGDIHELTKPSRNAVKNFANPQGSPHTYAPTSSGKAITNSSTLVNGSEESLPRKQDAFLPDSGASSSTGSEASSLPPATASRVMGAGPNRGYPNGNNQAMLGSAAPISSQVQRPIQVYPKVSPVAQRAAPHRPDRQPGSGPQKSDRLNPGGGPAQSVPGYLNPYQHAEGQDNGNRQFTPGVESHGSMNDSSYGSLPSQPSTSDPRTSQTSAGDSFESAVDGFSTLKDAGEVRGTKDIFDPAHIVVGGSNGNGSKNTSNYHSEYASSSNQESNNTASRTKHTSYSDYAEYMQTYFPERPPANESSNSLPAELDDQKLAHVPDVPLGLQSPPSIDKPSATSLPLSMPSPTSASPVNGFQSPYGSRTYLPESGTDSDDGASKPSQGSTEQLAEQSQKGQTSSQTQPQPQQPQPQQPQHHHQQQQYQPQHQEQPTSHTPPVQSMPIQMPPTPSGPRSLPGTQNATPPAGGPGGYMSKPNMLQPMQMPQPGLSSPNGMIPYGLNGPKPMGARPPQGMSPKSMPPKGMSPKAMPPQGMSPQSMPFPQGMMSPQQMPLQGVPPQGMSPSAMPQTRSPYSNGQQSSPRMVMQGFPQGRPGQGFVQPMPQQRNQQYRVPPPQQFTRPTRTGSPVMYPSAMQQPRGKGLASSGPYGPAAVLAKQSQPKA